MKVKHILTGSAVAILLLSVLPVSFVYAQVSATLVDPLIKIFPETIIPIEDFHEVDVAKGEVASAQLLLRSEKTQNQVKVSVNIQGLPGAVVSFGPVGYVRAERPYRDHALDRIASVSGFYPDPIKDNQPVNLPAGQAETFFITVSIPREAKAGTYPVKVSVQAGRQTLQKSFQIRVHNVVLEDQKLWITNWFNVSPRHLAMMNNGNKVEQYGDVYWKLIKILAEKLASYGQNVSRISPLDLATYEKKGDVYKIDFSRFDKTVEIFKDAGALKRIEGGHIGQRIGGWLSLFVVRVPEPAGDSTVFLQLPIDDPKAKAFYRQFLPALMTHLQEKGWLADYYQHIADEPIAENKQSYIDIANYVKSVVPTIKILEACHTKDLAETIDLWVPQMDFMNRDFDFYQDRKKAGDEVWFYTCLNPKGNYANRFIDLPLIKTRLLHWVNYKYNIEGYLHWGFNWWNDEPWVETTDAHESGGNFLPTGDAWIVYPGYQKLNSSIRLEAMRDGINDYTLLTMLEKKNPALAQQIVDRIIYKFDWYDTSVGNFRKLRKELLTGLARD